MKYGDTVVLKKDSAKQAKMGLYRENMIGIVFSNKPVNGKWQVQFVSDNTFFKEFLLSENEVEPWDNPFEKKAVSSDGEKIINYMMVELMVDKPNYTEKGLFKGSLGTVIEVCPYGTFLIDFSKKIEKQIYCHVLGNDLRVVKN